MKIIARKDHDTFLAEVSNTEIQKFFNTYWSNRKQVKVEVGTEFGLGEGHDFLRDIESALADSQRFMKSNAKIVETVLRGVTLFSSFGKSDDEPEGDKEAA